MTDGFDIKFRGHGATPTLLEGADTRTLLDGMKHADPHAPPDEFGGPDLRLY